MLVREVMTAPVVTVHADWTVKQAVRRLRDLMGILAHGLHGGPAPHDDPVSEGVS